MSGIDEQDVPPCDCKRFVFWLIFDVDGVIGYLNPDDWVKRNLARAVNRIEETRMLSKDVFVNSIASFRCSFCDRLIKKGCDVFDNLHRSVITRWDIRNVRGR